MNLIAKILAFVKSSTYNIVFRWRWFAVGLLNSAHIFVSMVMIMQFLLILSAITNFNNNFINCATWKEKEK